jgi:hypothetical protein
MNTREILDRAIEELHESLQAPPGTVDSPIVVKLRDDLFAAWDTLTEALRKAADEESS